MPANVETMFSVREVPWHGLGTIVDEALTSEEALEISGLNWDVEQIPLYAQLGNPFVPMGLDAIEGYKCNVRSTDKKVLGIVSDQYQVVQNKEAFSFVDCLLETDGIVKYETAGSLANGKRIWLLAKMPSVMILDDVIEPYLVFTTGHDGRHLIRVAITPIRVVCQNTLNVALSNAQRAWSTKHNGDMAAKLDDARETLQLANTYMSSFTLDAVSMANKVITNVMFDEMLKELYPMVQDANLTQISNVEQKRDFLKQAYIAQDIQKFVGTGWGVVNAVSDVTTHNLNNRQTQEALFNKTIDGHPMIDMAYAMVKNI